MNSKINHRREPSPVTTISDAQLETIRANNRIREEHMPLIVDYLNATSTLPEAWSSIDPEALFPEPPDADDQAAALVYITELVSHLATWKAAIDALYAAVPRGSAAGKFATSEAQNLSEIRDFLADHLIEWLPGSAGASPATPSGDVAKSDRSGRSTPAIPNIDSTLHAKYEANPNDLDPVLAWDHEGHALVADEDFGYLRRAESYTTFAGLVRYRMASTQPSD